MKKTAAILLALAIVGFATATSGFAAYYPNTGNFMYSGGNYADSYLTWTSPAFLADSGYEHDLVINPSFANYCTSWTNLPSGYDDCPTMGFDENNESQWVASFGTFHGNQIVPNTTYVGSWNLYYTFMVNPTSFFFDVPHGFTSATLGAQEVAREICPNDFIWCMGEVDGPGHYNPLAGPFEMRAGTYHFRTW